MLDCHGRPQIGVKKTQLPIKRPFVGIVSLVSIVFFFWGGVSFSPEHFETTNVVWGDGLVFGGFQSVWIG